MSYLDYLKTPANRSFAIKGKPNWWSLVLGLVIFGYLGRLYGILLVLVIDFITYLFINKRSGTSTQPQTQEKTIDLKTRSMMMIGVINEVSLKATDSVFEEIKKDYTLNDEKKTKILNAITCMTLLQAQKFFWENIIRDEKQARLFENLLFESFEEIFEFDAKLIIKEWAIYIKQGERGREVQVIGNTINKILDNKGGAIMEFLVSTTYFGFINEHFFEALKKAWEMEITDNKK